MAGKRKRGIITVQDVIEREGTTSYLVRSRRGTVLFRHAKPIIQKHDRDVLNALTQRWINDQPCTPLNTRNVSIQDNTAFLPLEGPNCSKQYSLLFHNYLLEVHGSAGTFLARDDLYRKLREPMSLMEFKNLYFHFFFQGEEELVDFPARVIENLKFLKISYEGKFCFWARAYSSWEKKHYNRKIKLLYRSMLNLQALRVYLHGSYSDNVVSEALLVRNVIMHLNQWKLRGEGEYYDKTEIVEIIYDLFPHIAFDLFDFCQFCGVDLDFTKLRKFFKA